jgi:hypothetical protein
MLQEIISLQIERENFERQADVIQSTSPFCQLPEPFNEALNEAIKIGDKQAKLWNELRGFLLKDKKTTIWQFAIKNNFPVRRFGIEEFLKLDLEQLNLINGELK